MVMEIEKKQGVNFDFILALGYDGIKSEVYKIPIVRQTSLIDQLLQMVEDDSYDAVAMHDLLIHSLNSNICSHYPYCLAHEYTDYLISDITFPDFDVISYRNSIITLRNKLMKKVYKQMNKFKGKAEIDELEVDKLIIKKLREDKKDYANKALPFIYAIDYHTTLIKYNIEQKFVIYSNEIHGRYRQYNRNFFIGKDIEVSIFTNFCYGRSTVFHCNVKYKKIALLPYSEWVNYYYAGYNEILKCTRSFYRKRDSWHYCFQFIKDFINSALKDPEKFFKEEVVREIRELIIGLESIMNLDDKKLEMKMQVKREDNDSKYIGVITARQCNEKDRTYFKIAPKECAMVFRMEKICGSLYFLKSLKELNVICLDVDNAIQRIIDLNNKIYPEVLLAIPPVSNEIKEMNREIKRISKNIQTKEKRMCYCERRIDKYRQKNTWDIKSITKEIFLELNKQRDAIKGDLLKLEEQRSCCEERLLTRISLLSKLREYQVLIETNLRSVR